METFEKVILGVILLMLALTISIVMFSNHKEAEMYNRLNDTNYTMSDFLWAKNQINTHSQTIKLK